MLNRVNIKGNDQQNLPFLRAMVLGAQKNITKDPAHPKRKTAFALLFAAFDVYSKKAQITVPRRNAVNLQQCLPGT